MIARANIAQKIALLAHLHNEIIASQIVQAKRRQETTIA